MPEEKKVLTVRAVVGGFFYLMGLVAMVYAFNTFLNTKIDQRLNDPTVTAKIAAQVRPFAIFTGGGTILVDNGAMDYVKDLKITTNGPTRIPDKILLVPKRYMAHAPLITPIDQVGTVVNAKRGIGLTWEYTFDVTYVLERGVGPEHKTTRDQDRYRMEIIQ